VAPSTARLATSRYYEKFPNPVHGTAV